MIERLRRAASLVTAAALLVAGPGSAWAGGKDKDDSPAKNSQGDSAAGFATTTPIKHVVVIFGENISFDHYFATYPYATNPTTETPFTRRTIRLA